MAALRIRRVELLPFALRLREPLRISLGELHDTQGVLVRIETEDGSFGLGEAAPIAVISGETQQTCLAAGKVLAEHCQGRDALAIEQRHAELARILPAQPAIHAGFDMALWDLMGQVTGLPVARLLGGWRETIATDETVWLAPLAEMQAKAQALVAAGVSTLKLKVGVAELEHDLDKVAAIREAIGPGPRLRLDANQAWDVPRAVAAARALARHDIELLEQPVPRHDRRGLAQVRRASPIPIMADESAFSLQDVLELVALQAVDFVNIKLMKCGGLTSARKIAGVCEAAGIAAMVGGMIESRLAVGAAAHLAAACPGITMADLDGFLGLAEDPWEGGIAHAPGSIRLADAPGLGTRPA